MRAPVIEDLRDLVDEVNRAADTLKPSDFFAYLGRGPIAVAEPAGFELLGIPVFTTPVLRPRELRLIPRFGSEVRVLDFDHVDPSEEP